MDRIWAPWRMEYIGKDQVVSKCVFCDKLESDRDVENYILSRSEKAFSLLNLYPYNNGHILVIPNRHVGDLTFLDRDELTDIGLEVQKMTKLLKAAFNPDGFNIGVNMGKAAGAGIPQHIHVHIVPRWAGDTNFMPVLGDLRVIPEALDMTYKRLKEAL